ncbi:ParB N-terminal domain-containing protein [Clostridium sp. Sa3CUN1]|uniref:ParB N-terminal domain-containing protein n=1 Tax=Clostridium gallinarum TaxID=2762246 RepID=A0ABR8Q1D2_9CLOT|nr:ParB N-terminal domain-containing protein [Clostridium gallinarum]MBD7914228.1 ParB N-terminal domain-containing protein [Clostridium gallinarum]
MAFNMMDLLNNNSRATQDKVESISKFKTIQINIDDLVPSRNNFYSIEEGGIKELKDSIELLGLQQNLVVNKLENGKYEIIAGHRRYMAMKMLYEEGNQNFKSIPCKVEEDDNIKNELRLIITNSTTRELSDWEKIHQASKLKELLIEYKKREKIPGRVRDIVANILNVSATQIARMESISKNLIEEFKEELKEDKVNFSSAYEISKLDKEKQKEIYEDNKENNSNITIKGIKKKAEAEEEKEEIEVLEGQVTLEEALDISKEDLKVNNEDEIIIKDDKCNVVTTVKVNKETGEIVEEKTISKFRNRIFIELENANLSDRVRYETLDLVQEYDELTSKYKNNDLYIDFISNSVNEGDIKIILNSEGIEIKAVDHFDLIEIYNKVILIAH